MSTTESEATDAAPERADNPFAGPIVAAPTSSGAAALVQREVAEVQAAMVIAKRFPRDPKQAVERILTSCARPTLADAAVYEYARGGQSITGPSIRLAEELARQWGNMLCGVTEIARSGGSSDCLAYAWDLETNFRDERRFTVKHWRDTRGGGYALTDERDIYETIANQGARRKRACILAVIPGDVAETAVKQCELTLHTKGEMTPERIKNVLKSFEPYGVTKEQLETRIQRNIDSLTPGQAVQLGKILNSLKDGMSKAGDWFEMPDAAEGAKTATDAARQKLDAKRGAASDKPTEKL